MLLNEGPVAQLGLEHYADNVGVLCSNHSGPIFRAYQKIRKNIYKVICMNILIKDEKKRGNQKRQNKWIE